MNIWHDIDKKRITAEDFIAVIEVSKNSKKKYELDKSTGLVILDRVLSTSMIYPENYGLIPLTLAEDHDPLDVLVLCQEPLEPLSLVEALPIGVLIMNDGGENDEKIIAVAKKDPQMSFFKDINQLPTHLLDEIANFFENYKTLENKHTIIMGYQDKDKAMQIINECMARYDKKYGKKVKKV